MIGIGTTVNGGFAEYCVVPESQAYRFDASLSYEMAAMTEPVACCLHGIDLCEIKPGATVLVIGGGMIGLLMLQLAKLSGAAKLILIEPIAAKREAAMRLGADLTIDPTAEDAAARLSLLGITQIDCVIECVGKTQTIEQAISLAGKYSTVMMFGLTKPRDEISIRPFEIFKKEITLKASFINPYTQSRALRLIESGRIDVSSMVIERASVDELPTILADKRRRTAGKILITF
jgi:2-desacetyl-2-hydroxyethyl bacteriochlorophyllide A dehydrogenase